MLSLNAVYLIISDANTSLGFAACDAMVPLRVWFVFTDKIKLRDKYEW